MTIKSVSSSQGELLRWISDLHVPNGVFDADISYGNGKFYAHIPEPLLKIDIEPLHDGVVRASSANLPIGDGSVRSIMFDPPFLTYIKSGRNGNGKMALARRFSGYWSFSDLESHYRATLASASRALAKGGVMVFKCQDIVHNHNLHATHAMVINWAAEAGFRLKDLFVLVAASRMPSPNRTGAQKHARVYHSYFLVLEKK